MIRVANICKRFKLYSAPADRLKELVLRKQCHVDYDALDDVSFEVPDGGALGVIGPNGAGKSTLLKILTGVTLPDSGKIDIDGRITGLLELGTGFNPELSGSKNIRDNGLLLGMSKAKIEEKRDAIIAFSELGDFINEPIKTYSSGMVMRLAFAIAIHADPKCFVVDEALSVGDAHFQQKCMKRIREFRNQGGSIVFVSHDMNSVKMLCDRAILLHHGKALESGDPETVINTYNFLISHNEEDESRLAIMRQDDQSYGTGEARIVSVSIDGQSGETNSLASGTMANVGVVLDAHSDMEDINVGILIRDRFGQDVFGTSLMYGGELLGIKAGERYQCSYSIPMDIAPGRYTISVAVARGETHVDHCIHWYDSAAEFEVLLNPEKRFSGLVNLGVKTRTESLGAVPS